jgi:hypothetical protein
MKSAIEAMDGHAASESIPRGKIISDLRVGQGGYNGIEIIF